MNHKILLAATLLSTSLFSATDTQVINYFKTQIPVPSIKIEVTSRINIENIEGMDYVSLRISDGSRGQNVSVFTQGNLIFPDVIDITNGGSIKEKLDKKKLIENISKLYKEENPSNILAVGNDPKKETIIVFTDPECPFCNKEVQKIESRLKQYNLKLIFTPVHDRSALEKSVLILKQAGKLTDVKEQVKIIKKYFNGEVDGKVSDAEVQNIQNLISKYFGAGLKGVPFIVNEKELLK